MGREPVRLFWWHRFKVFTLPQHGEDERALIRLAGNNRGLVAVAAEHEIGAGAQIEAALDLGLVVAVAGETFLGEERPDTADEMGVGVGRERGQRGRQK